MVYPIHRPVFPRRLISKEILKNLKTPFLIRARISSGSRGIAFVKKSEDFVEQYESVKRDFGEPMIQEYVQKKSYCTACVLLDHHSDEVASFAYERVKEYPLSGGPTVVGISCANDEVIGYAKSLLKSIGWRGVAEVEFIIDQAGDPKIAGSKPAILDAPEPRNTIGSRLPLPPVPAGNEKSCQQTGNLYHSHEISLGNSQ